MVTPKCEINECEKRKRRTSISNLEMLVKAQGVLPKSSFSSDNEIFFKNLERMFLTFKFIMDSVAAVIMNYTGYCCKVDDVIQLLDL